MKIYKIGCFVLYLHLYCTVLLCAQETKKAEIQLSGFAEVYYQYDFNNPINNSRPAFIYSHNRNNEFNINLAFVKASYKNDLLRSNIALATGTYMNANYADEPDLLKNIYEANLGFKISKSKNLWVDIGVFPSHIGFESAMVSENWTLTRSLAAENSPYFETGAKISYTSANGKWLLSALVLNGWQRIQRVNGNSTPAIGHQLSFTPHEKLTINSSSFIGNDKPDSLRCMRYFHNLYAIYKINEQTAIRAGFDIGAEQKNKGSRQHFFWYTPVLIAKHNISNRWSIAARTEFYRDKYNVKIATGLSNGLSTFGYSINSDLKILDNLLWRTEIRQLNNKNELFANRGKTLNRNNLTAVTSFSINF